MNYDSKKSQEAASDAKTAKYLAWCRKEGVIADKVEFPAVYGGVWGSRASQDIEPNEALLSVPIKMMISVEGAKNSDIGEIFKNHESIYIKNIDRDYLILITFLVYERLKLENSYWYSYFEIVDPGTDASNWPESAVNKTDDLELKMAFKAAQTKNNDDWQQI